MTTPLTLEEQAAVFASMCSAGIDPEESTTLAEMERELALKVWMAARAHYTAETGRLRERLVHIEAENHYLVTGEEKS